jgi:hypothetical protein
VQALPTNVPVALLTDLEQNADACLVWEAGQTEPAAITPPGSQGSRVAGCFVLFCPEQDVDGGQILEDGFVVTLTTASWETVRRALVEGRSLSLPATGKGFSISIESRDEVFVNPVDQKEYVASGGWETYRPDSSAVADQEGGKVKTEHIRLLTSQADIDSRTTVEDLAAFCTSVERCAELALGGSRTQFKLLVQFRCTAEGHQIQMAHQGEADPQLLQAFYDALAKIEKLPVRQEDVSFQLELIVTP